MKGSLFQQVRVLPRKGHPGRVDQFVVESLMVSLSVIMVQESANPSQQRAFSEEDHALETLVFDGANESLAMSVPTGTARR